ncbi:MAG: GNAT family N-acetyltransferase [Actinomycetota bacterium]
MDTTAAVRVSQLEPDDWAALRQIRLEALAGAPYAFSSTLADETGMTQEQWRARITRSPSFIAWRDGEPVGLVGGFGRPPAAEPAGSEPGGSGPGAGHRDWHLVSMWVSPQARGTGVAEQLVEAVCASARADGAARLTLWATEVNARARAFYQRMGFLPTGARQLVRPDEPDHWEEERALDLSQPAS